MIKTTLRSLRRRKGYVLINVLGLAVGMACCLLIGLYVNDELGYDRFHERGDRIYRVLADVTVAGETRLNSTTQGILGPVLAGAFPEIEETVRMGGYGALLRFEDRQFQENYGLVADEGFLRMFSYELLQGDPTTALAEPFSIILTPKMAQKYFGDENPLGQTLIGEGQYPLTVTGVLEVPATSHFQFDFLVPMSTVEPTAPDWQFKQWLSFNFQTYVMLREQGSPSALTAKFPAFLEVHAGEAMRQAQQQLTLSLEPLFDVYLRSDRGGMGARGNLSNLYLFTWIALFILLLACINFMNLATARSVERAREVGVRKLVGAHRGNLIGRFLGESCLVALLALPVALLLAELALPAFNIIAGKTLSGAVLVHPVVILTMVALAGLVGLVAGSYPAFVLSGFQPAQILKGRYASSSRGSFLRKGLVVLQFGISIVLITATAVVYSQLGYMQRQDLGFNAGSEEEQVLVLNFSGDGEVKQGIETLKAQLLSLSAVRAISASQTTPGSSGLPGAGGAIEDSTGIMRQANLNLYLVDFDFIDFYDMEVVAGRAFSPDFAGDSLNAYLLNETAIARYGFATAEDALGKQGRFWGREGKIIGVVKDFHHYGLNQRVPAMALRIDPGFAEILSLRIGTENLPETLEALEARWTELIPQRPFNYHFLDERFDEQYRAERRFGQLFSVFALLAVFIACLGLFGLASFTAAQRTKEIGIRKVLGATVPQIILLLSGDFTRLVAVAFVIAAPVAYFSMGKWLAAFPYATAIGWKVLLLAGVVALLAALITVSYKAYQAAASNPVDALRDE